MLLRNNSSVVGLSFGASKTNDQKQRDLLALANNRSPTERKTEQLKNKPQMSRLFQAPESEIDRLNVDDLDEFMRNQGQASAFEEEKQMNTGVFNNELMTFNQKNTQNPDFQI